MKMEHIFLQRVPERSLFLYIAYTFRLNALKKKRVLYNYIKYKHERII